MRPLRVTVIHPPVALSSDWIDYPYFSDLGAVQLAAVLREEGAAGGFEVRLIDAYALPRSTLHRLEGGRVHLGAPLADVLEMASPERAQAPADALVVAYTPFHRPPHRDPLLAGLLRGLRAMHPEAPLLLADAYQSGQHYVEAEGVLEAYPEADAWVKHEAEVTVPALLRRFALEGERPSGVHKGEPPPRLDALPDPAWDLVDLSAYERFRERVVARSGRGRWAFPITGAGAGEGGGRALPLVSTRGCPFRCAHCSSNPGRSEGEPKIQRRLSEARIAAQMRALKERFGATRLFFLDELINVRRSHFEAVLEAAEALDLSLEVPNGFRADYLDRAHIERLRGRATTLSVSAESGAPRVLDDVVGKELDLAHIERCAKDAHEVGVPLMIHFMIGLPGESAEEINATLALALSLFDRYEAEPAVQYATPLPGTRLAAKVEAAGRRLPLVEEWGPAFQKLPTLPATQAGAVGPETLALFLRTFERRLAASRGPKKLILNATYACNNRCTFCAVGTRTQVHGHPPRQREQLLHYRERGVRLLDIDGGEPTLNDELIPLIRYARHIGYEKINVTTNGRRLAYEPYAAELIRSGLTSLLFSVHGPDARTHAQQVGVAEAFEQTVEGIRHAVALASSELELGMNVTITKGNHRLLPELAELALSLGLPWLNLQFLTPFGRATKWVAPDTAAAAKIATEVIDAYGDRMKIRIINLPFCFMPGYEAFMTGDLLKLERHMVFVNNESVNLAEYLAERRTKRKVCRGCPHACFCGGFYELEDVPEPPWLIAPEDLLRPLRPAR